MSPRVLIVVHGRPPHPFHATAKKGGKRAANEKVRREVKRIQREDAVTLQFAIRKRQVRSIARFVPRHVALAPQSAESIRVFITIMLTRSSAS